jgi:acyl dehydratase
MSAAKRLDSPPSLGSLYARAAVTGPLHRGDTLADSVYELAGRRIDPRQLAEYDRVCGLRYGDVLPATYLHVLAFPLSVALMVERAFPFPLAGLVHVANAITVHRPVRIGETVGFTVRADNLRPHASGRQFDLLADATVAGELVWHGRSTYLRRSGRPSGSPKVSRARPPAAPLAGAVARVRVPGDIGRRYGAVSGDRNPIHLSALTAKAFGFSSAIAHGMWLKARVLATLEGRLPDSYTVEVAFKAPVLLPATVAVGTERDGDRWVLDVRDARSGRPHLSGTVVRV